MTATTGRPTPQPRATTRMPRVVIIGAGFGGLTAAQALRTVAVRTIVVDTHNYHLFTPLLYQVASALLDPGEIAQPTRAILRRVRNADARVATVTGVDLEARRLQTGAGVIDYDYLILAAGSVDNYFGIEGMGERAFELKDLDSALALRNRVLRQFEQAAWTDDPQERRRLLTFAIVGAGPTGVEFAGALSELIALVLRHDFSKTDISGARVVLIEGGDVLATFVPRLRRAAERTLRRKGVDVRLGAMVVRCSEQGLELRDGSRVEARTVIWTAGVRGADIVTAVTPNPATSNRIAVTETLQLPGHPEVFVIGDLAEFRQDGEPLPMLIPVAMQQGRHAAASIGASVQGGTAAPFRYRDPGTMATIGRNAAVAQLGPVHVSGFLGWLMWLGLHLVKIVGFRNRVVVLVNWAWEYVRYDRPVRLITGIRPPQAGAPEDGSRGA